MIDRYGADNGAASSSYSRRRPKKTWTTDAGAEGAYRFLGRVFKFVTATRPQQPAVAAR